MKEKPFSYAGSQGTPEQIREAEKILDKKEEKMSHMREESIEVKTVIAELKPGDYIEAWHGKQNLGLEKGEIKEITEDYIIIDTYDGWGGHTPEKIHKLRVDLISDIKRTSKPMPHISKLPPKEQNFDV